MSRLLVIIVVCLLCSGCGLSARQVQNLADGLAGIEAVEPRVAHDPTTTTILAGTHDYIEAVAIEAGEPLPAPLRSPASIAHDPTGYADAGNRAVDEAQNTVPWWGWALGAIGATLGVVRLIPGPGGALADFIWRLLAPSRQRQDAARRDTYAEGLQTLVGLIEVLPNTATVGDLKAKVTTKVPSPIRDAILSLVGPSGSPDPLR